MKVSTAETAALRTNARTAQAPFFINLQSGMLAAGTPLAAWADDAASAPGITLANSKSKCVRWNNNATQVAVWYEHPIPPDLDETAPLVLHAQVSKSGATDADDAGLTVAAFFVSAGALHDADSDCGGDTSLVDGAAAAKTVTEVTLAITAANVPAPPGNISFSVKPLDLGTDDFMLHALWFEYKRKILTS